MLTTFTWHTSKVKTSRRCHDDRNTLAGTGAGSSVTKSPQLLNLVVGTKFKVIVGYSGTGATMLATERGELDGMSTGWGGSQCRAAELAQGPMINMIVQMGTVRHPDMPDVPSWIDIAKTEDDKKLLWLFGANADIGKSLVAPPGLPPARVAMLRTAFCGDAERPGFPRRGQEGQYGFRPCAGRTVAADRRRRALAGGVARARPHDLPLSRTEIASRS